MSFGAVLHAASGVFAGIIKRSMLHVDWSTVGTVHVFDVEIIPDSTYEVQAIGYGCALGDEEGYSDPLEITTSKWGDIVGNCAVTPCTPPDGAVGFSTDVTAALDKWKNLPGNVMKVRADLEGSPAGSHALVDQSINCTDVTWIFDPYLGAPYPDMFAECPFAECDEIPPVGGCEADIRVDSNNDGVIDFIDDFLEETQGVVVMFNSDDDNENDIADWEETTVTGEDDLVEMQLSAPNCAPGMWIGWSLSWDVTASLKVWWYPDKYCPTSECPGYETEPLFNYNEDPGYYLFNRLPRSVWLEAIDATGDDFDITFTIHAATGGDGVSTRPDPDKKDVVKGEVDKCTYGALNPTGAKLNPTGTASGVLAKITKRTAYLCPSKVNPSASLAWISLGHGQDPGPPPRYLRWVQTGWVTYRGPEWPEDVTLSGVYAEQKNGCDLENEDQYKKTTWPVMGIEETIFKIIYTGSRWDFYSPVFAQLGLGDTFHFDRERLQWEPTHETVVKWSTEILHKEDQVYGTQGTPCNFELCLYWIVGGGPFDAKFKSGGATVKSIDDNEWGIIPIGEAEFNTWDKKPQE